MGAVWQEGDICECWKALGNGMWGGRCWKGNTDPFLANGRKLPVSSLGKMLGPDAETESLYVLWHLMPGALACDRLGDSGA